MEAMNINPDNIDKSGMARIMIMSFILTFIIMFSIAVLIALIGITGAGGGFKLGLLCGVGFIFTTQYINSLYEKRTMKLVLINSGYPTVGMIIGAIILAIWQ
jgi:multisubunit Na+/H+ antiporter MnhB subunit